MLGIGGVGPPGVCANTALRDVPVRANWKRRIMPSANRITQSSYRTQIAGRTSRMDPTISKECGDNHAIHQSFPIGLIVTAEAWKLRAVRRKHACWRPAGRTECEDRAGVCPQHAQPAFFTVRLAAKRRQQTHNCRCCTDEPQLGPVGRRRETGPQHGFASRTLRNVRGANNDYGKRRLGGKVLGEHRLDKLMGVKHG